MKKIIFIIVTTLMATTAWAQSQQLQTVKGKTKDGKSINVQYYKGVAQDYIESVKYQLVDELKADNKNKQNSINDLQYQLNKANKRIEELNSQQKKSGSSDQINQLQDQLSQKQNEIDQLNEQINELNRRLGNLQNENGRLQRQVDSLDRINSELRQKKNRLAMSPVIGVEASMGSVFLSKTNLHNPWEKALSWNKQAAIYFGSGRLSESFPISIEAGVGFRSLPISAKFDYYKASNSYQDCDGDLYQPIFENCSEKLTVNCLEVPVRFCLGQPDNSKVSVYTKLGVTPSFILSSNMANGAYTRHGYYSNWNVTFEDIEELDYFNNGGENKQEIVPARKFNLWGNAAFGAYVPLNSSISFNVGAKVDYPILKTSSFDIQTTASDKSNFLLPEGLEKYEGRMFIPSLQAGVVYTVR